MTPSAQPFISFCALFGDAEGERMVWPYIYGTCGVLDLLEEQVSRGGYSEQIDLILICLFVEGSEDWFKMPAAPRLGRLRKDKGIRYDVPLRIGHFFPLSPADKRDVLIQHMLDAVNACETRFRNGRVPFQAELLRKDLMRAIHDYRQRPLPAT
ncbi:hypothetical protein [Leeia aquatica]|uniref:Uncharacterized protein n=1 Tax=Leeia aquatica TaxID=2725557 RepID=A0A847S9Y9_9NEIS|nr:hypothetical protein [Leeia aquatica]NLR75685.1 hypothetical protein [Leeia aquatica]